MRWTSRYLTATAVLGVVCVGTVNGQEPPDLKGMDVADLLNVKVTSVSRRGQKISRAAAAVFVISQEDIRRSGALSLPDVLTMAPGVVVERIDASTWAISIRGFNARYSNKVLVLLDGRTVYTPMFSGVYWDQLDFPLENIDRIEVVRGPGGTVWGANAVNGVISIFTKSAKETQGNLARVGGGSQSYARAMARHGGAAGSKGAYSVYGELNDVGSSESDGVTRAYDRWKRGRTGFRSDWDVSGRDSVMVQGDLFGIEATHGRRNNFIPSPFDIFRHERGDAAGGSLLARWEHTRDSGSQTTLQTSFATYRRTELGVPEVLHVFDLDFQHHFQAGDRHDIVWGADYRASTSKLPPGYPITVVPLSKTDTLVSTFLQDEIELSGSVWLIAGSKIERNAYTGITAEPGLRLIWSPPDGRHTVWAAASRAIRQPSRVDATIDMNLQVVPLPGNAISVAHLSGNTGLKNEEARTFEAGYRSEIGKRLSFDVAAYRSFYRHLLSFEPQAPVVVPGDPTRYISEVIEENDARANTFGGEVFLRWKPVTRWQLIPGYSYLHPTITVNPASHGLSSDKLTGFPAHMYHVRSLFNLTRRMEFDQTVAYTSGGQGSSSGGHTRLDVRISRRVGETAEISLIGQNLLRPHTLEFGDSETLLGTQTLRSVYGQISWRF